MDGPLRLGGNIELYNAQFDPATMVVLKKILGMYARKFSEQGCQKLAVSFGEKTVAVEAHRESGVLSSSAVHSNVFFSMDAALKEIERQL